MEEFRVRVRQHSDAVSWLAGRRAWSAVRSAALLDSDSVLRRTMRETRAQAAPREPSTVGAATVHPEVLRIRGKLGSDDDQQVTRGARLLLELTEPSSLEAARVLAFPGSRGTPVAEAALGRAWEAFRHDRHRAVN